MDTLNNTSLSAQIYDQLKPAIINQELASLPNLICKGSPIPFGFRRGIASKAFIQLNGDGLLRRKNRLGTFVAPLTKSKSLEKFEASCIVKECAIPVIFNNLSESDLHYFEVFLTIQRIIQNCCRRRIL